MGDAKRARRDVQRILRELSQGCRHLVARVYLEGSTYASLSRELDIEEASVRSRVSRCMKKAREIVGSEGWK